MARAKAIGFEHVFSAMSTPFSLAQGSLAQGSLFCCDVYYVPFFRHIFSSSSTFSKSPNAEIATPRVPEPLSLFSSLSGGVMSQYFGVLFCLLLLFGGGFGEHLWSFLFSEAPFFFLIYFKLPPLCLSIQKSSLFPPPSES